MAKRKPKAFLASEAWVEFRKEYENSDDRSCALLCASYVDTCLEVVILEALTRPELAREHLFPESMPLGTFSAKIKIAYCLNIFDEKMYNDLERVRKIRNRFAHELHGLSFKKDPIKSWALSMTFPEDWNADPDEEFTEMLNRDSRDRFTFTCAISSSVFENHWHKKAKAVHEGIMNAKVRM